MENEQVHSASTVTDVADAEAAAKAAEAARLFEKLFAKNEPASTTNVPGNTHISVGKKDSEGETFTRKVSADQSTIAVPDRFVDTPNEVAVPAPRHSSVQEDKPKTHLTAQDIPTAVDAVRQEAEKVKRLAKATVAKSAVRSDVNFPERVNHLKKQNDMLRIRLANLE